ncbi:MAG: cytochrome c oxidase subunit II [Myxococcales bacterium]|nr:cytochrome c oxidase subunit II [Myxococcales bacterium]
MTDFLRAVLFLPDPASSSARGIDLLHFFVLGVSAVGSLLVFVLAIWFTVRYRRRSSSEVGTPVSSPRGFEVGTAFGMFALFVLWWGVGFKQYIEMHQSPKQALDIHVVAKQWMWKFEQADGDVTLGVLVVPADRDVRLLLTSRDVVHSFYVPALRLKQDAVPAMTTSIAFHIESPGTFRLLCAEYCGLSHSRMRGRVVALSPEDWDAWKAGRTPEPVAAAKSELEVAGPLRQKADETIADRGRAAAVSHGCMSCHTATGEKHIGPSWAGLYRRQVTLEDGRHVTADENYLTRSMMDPSAQLVRGYQDVMPTYQGQIPQAEAAAIVAYIQSLRDVRRRPEQILESSASDAGPPSPPPSSGTQQGAE